MKRLLFLTMAMLLCVAVSAQQTDSRNFRLSARNPKGKVISDLDLKAVLSGEKSPKQLDRFGNMWLKVTDSDTLNILVNNQIYVFPVAGLDSLDLIFKGNRKLEGIKSPDDIILDVGYGTVSARDNTYAVSKLNMENIEAYTDLRSYMQGRVPGVNFMGGKLIIRGLNSINLNNEALIVVDGISFSSFEDANTTINPQDIESISVLKDASSSIYGSRGANGVVLITTKNGAPKE
jgi:TonB-dependent SusC/RagA subfamily outer membrane receptor